jgi:hypothetical protein
MSGSQAADAKTCPTDEHADDFTAMVAAGLEDVGTQVWAG